METTLVKQIKAILDDFDLKDEQLKESRNKTIANAIEYNIKSGLLKSELN